LLIAENHIKLRVQPLKCHWNFAKEFGMRALAVDTFQSKIAVLDEISQAGLDPDRLSHLLKTWVDELLGGQSRVWLRKDHPTIPISENPEISPQLWRFPLRYQQHLLGVLEVDLSESREVSVSPSMVARLVDQFAALVDASCNLEAARQLAVQDELTGLGNRRMLESTLEMLIRKAHQEGFPFSILMFDVDHFKRFNDLWGHEVGDHALCLVADLMRRVFRQDDIICRIGGEEFVVVLADRADQPTDGPPAEAKKFAERLLREADALRLSDEQGRLLSSISLSGGLATFPWDGQSPAELLRSADRALHEAKTQGRNRICLAGGRVEVSHIIPIN
jgi:diguanylate cyclase (GGDEF)-like protein